MTIDERLAEWYQRVEGNFVAGVEAAKFVDQMREERPEEFQAWLDERAQAFVTILFQRVHAAERRQAKRDEGPRRFQKFLETGDDSALDRPFARFLDEFRTGHK